MFATLVKSIIIITTNGLLDVTFMLHLTQPCRKGGQNQKMRMNEEAKGWGRY